MSRNLRGLLEQGVQKAMDPEEPKGPIDPSMPPLAIETMLGYTRAVGTALWFELSRDRGKVRVIGLAVSPHSHWGQRGSYLAGTL